MTTDTKHTPGKWRLGHRTDYGVFNPSVIQAEDGTGIASVYGIPLHVKLEEIESDPRCAEGLARARLIAKAPELLRALKMLARGGDHYPEPNCWCGMAVGDPRLKDHDEACKVARDLLAEIEGAQ